MLERLANKISLRHQISLVTGAVGLTIVAAVTLGSALLARAQATDMAENALLQVARSVADRLDQDMAERLREIRNVAALDPLQPHWMERIPGVSATSCNRCRRPSRIMPGSALRTRPERFGLRRAVSWKVRMSASVLGSSMESKARRPRTSISRPCCRLCSNPMPTERPSGSSISHRPSSTRRAGPSASWEVISAGAGPTGCAGRSCPHAAPN